MDSEQFEKLLSKIQAIREEADEAKFTMVDEMEAFACALIRHAMNIGETRGRINKILEILDILESEIYEMYMTEPEEDEENEQGNKKE